MLQNDTWYYNNTFYTRKYKNKDPHSVLKFYMTDEKYEFICKYFHVIPVTILTDVVNTRLTYHFNCAHTHTHTQVIELLNLWL